MWIQFNLLSDLTRNSAREKLVKMLETVDKLLLTGPMKAWITNHYIVAKMSWTLLIQDFPSTVAKEWDKVIKNIIGVGLILPVVRSQDYSTALLNILA
jgi:hypothetical protein